MWCASAMPGTREMIALPKFALQIARMRVTATAPERLPSANASRVSRVSTAPSRHARTTALATESASRVFATAKESLLGRTAHKSRVEIARVMEHATL